MYGREYEIAVSRDSGCTTLTHWGCIFRHLGCFVASPQKKGVNRIRGYQTASPVSSLLSFYTTTKSNSVAPSCDYVGTFYGVDVNIANATHYRPIMGKCDVIHKTGSIHNVFYCR